MSLSKHAVSLGTFPITDADCGEMAAEFTAVGIIQAGGDANNVNCHDSGGTSKSLILALLSFTREGHSADLLADGTVRISCGSDHFGKQVAVSEIYDPITKRWVEFSDQISAMH